MNKQSEKLAMKKSDTEWRDQLTPEQYNICRCGGTEAPFTGKYWDCKTDGIYLCAACETPLFNSRAKYDSGSGWPSFWQGISSEAITEKTDTAHSMVRTEVVCTSCDSHLGHLFPDGPQPTGIRYCINSASLYLKEQS